MFFLLIFRALLNDLIALENADGYNPWREKEAKELSDLVQRRLKFLQNPKNCNEAKKLVCNVNKVSIFLIYLLSCLFF